jgi:hypothetical protein
VGANPRFGAAPGESAKCRDGSGVPCLIGSEVVPVSHEGVGLGASSLLEGPVLGGSEWVLVAVLEEAGERLELLPQDNDPPKVLSEDP